eukprot:9708590-Lingulodinium_polyedra.AAC.1
MRTRAATRPNLARVAERNGASRAARWRLAYPGRDIQRGADDALRPRVPLAVSARGCFGHL